MHDAKTHVVDLGRGTHGFRIAIERDQPSFGGKLGENTAAVAASAERTVDVQTVGTGDERLGRLLAENGKMNERLGHDDKLC